MGLSEASQYSAFTLSPFMLFMLCSPSSLQFATGLFPCWVSLQRSSNLELQPTDDMYHAALRDIMEHLLADGKTLADFNLPQPPTAGPRQNRLLYQEQHGYDSAAMAEVLTRVSGFNQDQQAVYDSLTASLAAYAAGTLLEVSL